jgi:hypothetical protein
MEELNMTREEALNQLELLYHDYDVCKSELSKYVIYEEIEYYEGALEEEQLNINN